MRRLMAPIVKYFYETPMILGNRVKLKLGKKVALVNTLINLSSGDIQIGDSVHVIRSGEIIPCITHKVE